MIYRLRKGWAYFFGHMDIFPVCGKIYFDFSGLRQNPENAACSLGFGESYQLDV